MPKLTNVPGPTADTTPKYGSAASVTTTTAGYTAPGSMPRSTRTICTTPYSSSFAPATIPPPKNGPSWITTTSAG